MLLGALSQLLEVIFFSFSLSVCLYLSVLGHTRFRALKSFIKYSDEEVFTKAPSGTMRTPIMSTTVSGKSSLCSSQIFRHRTPTIITKYFYLKFEGVTQVPIANSELGLGPTKEPSIFLKI